MVSTEFVYLSIFMVKNRVKVEKSEYCSFLVFNELCDFHENWCVRVTCHEECNDAINFAVEFHLNAQNGDYSKNIRFFAPSSNTIHRRYSKPYIRM